MALRESSTTNGRMNLSRLSRHVAFLGRASKGRLNTETATEDEIKMIREVFGNLLDGFFVLSKDQKKKLRANEAAIVKCFSSSKACRRNSTKIRHVFKIIRSQVERLLQTL